MNTELWNIARKLNLGKDFLNGLDELLTSLEKDKKQLIITDVVVTLPSVKSNEFQRWTQSKGYKSVFNGLWYEKNNQAYNTDLLYRAFTNEIEFGN